MVGYGSNHPPINTSWYYLWFDWFNVFELIKARVLLRVKLMLLYSAKADFFFFFFVVVLPSGKGVVIDSIGFFQNANR